MEVDSHHHFWKYDPDKYAWIGKDMGVLKRDFLPADLSREIEAAGIDGVVSVQARQTIEETRWLLEIAAQHDFILGVVGWVPLATSEIGDVLDSFDGSPWLKAVRHVVQDEPDDEFILRDDFNRGVALLKDFGLVYDVLIFAKHLLPTIRFVDRHQDQPFVLDHIAKPTIAAAQFHKTWAAQLRELARRENVVCKFSGVVTEVRDREWSLDLLRPYWDVALAAFGPDRLLFGSDWPVCLLRSDYGKWVSTVRALIGELSNEEQAAILGGNAARAYALGTKTPAKKG